MRAIAAVCLVVLGCAEAPGAVPRQANPNGGSAGSLGADPLGGQGSQGGAVPAAQEPMGRWWQSVAVDPSFTDSEVEAVLLGLHLWGATIPEAAVALTLEWPAAENALAVLRRAGPLLEGPEGGSMRAQWTGREIEIWADGATAEMLAWAAAHELGHAFGVLEHVNTAGALMDWVALENTWPCLTEVDVRKMCDALSCETVPRPPCSR